MKTFYLAFLCFFLPAYLYSQDWKPFKIDDSVQVSLPTGFKKIDTLGQTQITAETSFGFIQITKQADNPHTTPDIEKVKHLNRYYNDFVKRIRTSSKNGTISHEKDTVLGKLHVKDFSLEVDSGSGNQIRNFRLLHENGATYSFQFLYKDISKEYAIPESKTFFESIKITEPLTIESQFTTAGNTTGKAPRSNSTLFICIGAAVLALLLILFFRRRKRSG
jgi:hypothetical protein